MTEMIILAEHQIAKTTTPIDMQPGGADAQIANSGSGRQQSGGNDASLSSDLDAIASMTYAELHLAWRRHYRTVPAKKMSRDILELGIAWKIQENRHGGLGAAVKRQIADLARTMEAKSDLAKPRAVTPKAGARLLRTWNDVTHEVLVVEDGFLWAGKTWRSLSVIAREITGTRWSGPRFFGLSVATGSSALERAVEESEHA